MFHVTATRLDIKNRVGAVSANIFDNENELRAYIGQPRDLLNEECKSLPDGKYMELEKMINQKVFRVHYYIEKNEGGIWFGDFGATIIFTIMKINCTNKDLNYRNIKFADIPYIIVSDKSKE